MFFLLYCFNPVHLKLVSNKLLYFTDCLDIGAARTLLDNDHYAMDKLKRRVLEYLAVRQLKTTLKVGLTNLITCYTFYECHFYGKKNESYICKYSVCMYMYI